MSTETEQLTKEQIVAKIVKLLRLSKSSNQHEAELAAQRASEMMAKYQIDATDVETKNVQNGSDGVVAEMYTVKDQKMKLHWLETLAVAAASLYDGTVLVGRGLHGTNFKFVGFRSEIPLMQATFEHLFEAWKGFVDRDLGAAKEAHDDFVCGPWQPRHTMKFKHGHGQGYAESLAVRCTILAKERKQKVQQSHNGCTSLVLVREGAINLWKQQNGVRNAKISQTQGDLRGYHAGHAAGRSVALGGALRA